MEWSKMPHDNVIKNSTFKGTFKEFGKRKGVIKLKLWEKCKLQQRKAIFQSVYINMICGYKQSTKEIFLI